MTRLSESLAPTLRDLEDTIADLRSTAHHACEPMLARLVAQLDEEPMAELLVHALPAVDFTSWWKEAEASAMRSSMAGAGQLDWPHDRAERIAMQIALLQRLAHGEPRFLEHLINFHYSGRNNIQEHVELFCSRLLQPLLRDLRRLAEMRVIPPVLAQEIGRLPLSGDTTFDGLVREAIAQYQDPNPTARQLAAEKLWDAWERLKTLDDADKKRGSTAMLDRAAQEPTLRAHLETEANTLTKLGNDFQIRHFETSKTAIADPAQLDYLFHRLFSLIQLVLVTRARP
jgi:hypothetical protein